MTRENLITVPVGTTLQRPSGGTLAAGQTRFNSTDSKFEVYDGSSWVQLSSSGTTYPGRVRSVSVYTTGTGATHTPAAGTRMLEVIAVGGGGGGGGAEESGANSGSGAGRRGGGVCRKLLATAPTLTYTVGAKGTGGTAGPNAGTDAGDTTVTGTGIALTAKGGKGGGSMAAGTTYAKASGGAATSGTTGGDWSIEGGAGFHGSRIGALSAMGGNGASGPYGSGGAGGPARRVEGD